VSRKKTSFTEVCLRCIAIYSTRCYPHESG
jgi:hypothetical protein